jgi:hypothetical protein
MKYLYLLLLVCTALSGLLNSTQAQNSPASPLPSPLSSELRIATQFPSTGSARQATALEAAIRYVKAGASGSGASWSDAGDLQTMIIQSAAGDQVWIAGGGLQAQHNGIS